MITEINQDIFKVPVDVIIHQANCFCTMGSGIAKEIRARFPGVYKADLKTKKGDVDKLGQFSYAVVAKPKPLTGGYIIFNLYGQYRYGRDKRYTDYEAVEKGFNAIKDFLIREKLEHYTIGIPHKMGCKLGGGNWEIYSNIIKKVFGDSDFDILICKLN